MRLRYEESGERGGGTPCSGLWSSGGAMRGEMVKMMVVSDGGKTVHMDTPSVLGLDERCIEYL